MPDIIEYIVSQGHGTLEPSYLCIHETANPDASALDHVHYWQNDDTYAVHYVADWTEKIYHCVPDDRLCWQVGRGNEYVIGIELCHATNEHAFELVWNTGIEWAVYMLESRGWGIDRLLSHNDCRKRWGGTDHEDPDSYFEEFGRSWDEFVNEVARELYSERGNVMNFQALIQPDGEEYMTWYDGQNLHDLCHPDEMEAVQMMYKQITGEDIPIFSFGTKDAPWFHRFADALSHGHTFKPHM